MGIRFERIANDIASLMQIRIIRQPQELLTESKIRLVFLFESSYMLPIEFNHAPCNHPNAHSHIE